MDFFESQDAARRTTGRLVVLFALAVAAIIVSVYLVLAGALVVVNPEAGGWDPLLFLAVAGVTTLVVGCGSLYKIVQLRGGGRVVAESLGGSLMARNTTDPGARRILNVVEEMAIASGTPVPPVYLLAGEKGINAFAAGYSPSDAVIGVTQGCLDQLNRSELQGVIGHEFSHILNGDMRLNIRILGVLNGILVIGMIGYMILRSVRFRSVGRTRGKGKQGGAVLAVLGVGAGLAVVGFMGTFFGNLIRAAVSRQREYLADASGVQFTRDPDSLAGALRRIGGFSVGSAVRIPSAVEVSHMFFAKALVSGFGSLFATHPPLPDRIRRIDPAWDGTFLPPRDPGVPEAPAASPAGVDAAGAVIGGVVLAGEALRSAGEGATGTPARVVSRVGQPSTAHVDYAEDLVRALPAPVVAATREAHGARAVIYALLLNREEEVRQNQIACLADRAEEDVARLVMDLIPLIDRVPPETRLPIVDMAAPALRDMAPAQATRFAAIVRALTRADDRISLFEWVLHRMILRHLEPHYTKVRTAAAAQRNLGALERECSVLISAIVHSGRQDDAGSRAAFARARDRLGLPGLRLLDEAQSRLEDLDRSLTALDGASFAIKRALLEAAAASVAADARVTVEEVELLRGIADALDCPVPPVPAGPRAT